MTAFLTVASVIIAAAAAVFVFWQARIYRFTLQVQSLFAVEARFNGQEYRRRRHFAARQLLMNKPAGEVEDVLDFLETIALLVRRGALDVEMVYHTFFYWIDGYHRAAEAMLDKEHARNPRVWEDLSKLYQRVLAIENTKGLQRQDPVKVLPGGRGRAVSRRPPMIAAVYVRKSTEQNGVGDEEKSVTRQVEHARAYAARKGWTVEHVYADDGISGAELGDRRPGLARLLSALKPRPPFQVLVMAEESRPLESPTEKLLLSVSGYADEMERERGRQRTTDAMVRIARAGQPSTLQRRGTCSNE